MNKNLFLLKERKQESGEFDNSLQLDFHNLLKYGKLSSVSSGLKGL